MLLGSPGCFYTVLYVNCAFPNLSFSEFFHNITKHSQIQTFEDLPPTLIVRRVYSTGIGERDTNIYEHVSSFHVGHLNHLERLEMNETTNRNCIEASM